jgi:hypothetical protein
VSGLICVPPSCHDGVLDGTEDQVDCGGPLCGGCPTGDPCRANEDCASAACDAQSLTCVASQCADRRQDGQETDVDCGGPCAPCAVGQKCHMNPDCQTQVCNTGTLLCHLPYCMDGVKDGLETDIDCGGTICHPCALGQGCSIDSDCVSNACDYLSRTCVADPCADHRRDGSESDIDCGGTTCAGCALNHFCNSTSDCRAGLTCNASFYCQ